MAQIDHSIYFQQQTPDIVGSIESGMKMGDLMRQRKKENDIQAAYKAGMVQNPDGTISFDEAKTMSGIAKIDPQQAMSFQQQQIQRKNDLAKLQREKQQRDLEDITRAAWKVNDQASYDAELGALKSKGIDVSQMPPQYNQQMIDQVRRQTLSVKERLDQLDKENTAKLNQEKFNLDQKKFELDQWKAKNEVKSGDKLPIDAKKTIETLATKNATKLSIKNQIDAVVDNWDSFSDDQKVAQGRQLLKTLNSTEGADAIGVEEANRLGSKLEFAMGNFTNSNPTQFGRDLSGFKEQAQLTSQGIGKAIAANKKQIDSAYGRPSAPLKPETKEWEGVTYKKVGDEWVPQL
ncbi:MAG: hypothetical protein JNL11_17515 [Bdellovibrionaceae bacterium]|nr:hypothetical protein [Pseudobdellovibrionaceae bacterium]